MKKSSEKIYTLENTFLENITEHQLLEFKSQMSKDDTENIKIPFTHKGYRCNDGIPECINSKIQAISFFSGCGGLDIGAQLAGVKVISSLDFYEDSVKTLQANKFFDHSEHFTEDISNVKGDDFKKIIDERKTTWYVF